MPDDPALSFNLQVRLIYWHSVVQTILNEGGSPETEPPSFLEHAMRTSTLLLLINVSVGIAFAQESRPNGKKKETQVGPDGKVLDH
jgi:hypothetical protein